MAAVTSDKTPTGARTKTEVLETVAITNQTAASTAVTRALKVPTGANAALFIVDMTITGTTPTFAFKVEGGQTAGGRSGATFDSTTDIYEFTSGGPAAIVTMTTDASTPIATLQIGPGVATDTTGSATANSSLAFSCAVLPEWLIYTYTTTDSADDADYNGTISVVWDKVLYGLEAYKYATAR